MISPLAVKRFMARPMRDSAEVKSLSERKINSLLERTGAQFVTEPRHAQKVCFLLGWKYPAYLFLLGMGAGKSKLVLDLYQNLDLFDGPKRALVLVPNVVNIQQWMDEVEKHATGYAVDGIFAKAGETKQDKLEKLVSGAPILVTTYTGLGAVVCDSKGKGWVINRHRINKLAAAFDVLIMDECSNIKNHKSIYY